MGEERGHAQFAVDFLRVVVDSKKVDEGIGTGDARDIFCGEKGRETFLPEEMETLDLAFGLRGRSRMARSSGSFGMQPLQGRSLFFLEIPG